MFGIASLLATMAWSGFTTAAGMASGLAIAGESSVVTAGSAWGFPGVAGAASTFGGSEGATGDLSASTDSFSGLAEAASAVFVAAAGGPTRPGDISEWGIWLCG